jgi:hypothetical protein
MMTRIEFIDWLEGKGFEKYYGGYYADGYCKNESTYEIHIMNKSFGISIGGISIKNLNYPQSPEHAAEFFRILGIEF